jgi:TIGR03009 family protein
MRIGKTLAVVVAAAVGLLAAQAQTPAPQGNQDNPAPATADPRLDQLLARWENETRGVQQTMMAEIKSVRKDHVFNKKRQSTGWIKFMRPDLARVELADAENPERYERWICTGAHVYNFAPAEKVIYVFPLEAARKGQLPDQGPAQFLFDMKADLAKKRYELKITKVTEHYTYIDVFPRFEADMQDFSYARLVILNKTNLPLQLYWVEPNKTEVTWDIVKIHKDAPQLVKRTEFEKPSLPDPTWKWGDTRALNDARPAAKPTGSGKSQGGSPNSPRVIRPQTPEK